MAWCQNVTLVILIAWIALLVFHFWILLRRDGDSRHVWQHGNGSFSKRPPTVPLPVGLNPSSTLVKGPIHSWKTVPVSFHGCRPDTRGPTGLEFHPKDLEALKRYPLITLEKWQGTLAFSTNICRDSTRNSNSNNNTNVECWNATMTSTTDGSRSRSSSTESNIFYWGDDAWISAAQQIKAVHPTASIAVWMDTMLIYTGWSWPPPNKYTNDNLNRTLNPDIGVPCSTGHFRPAEFLEQHGASSYLLINTSGLPALESWSHCHVYDHTQAHVRQYWKELCLNFTNTGLIDGCGADFSALEANQWSTHTTEYIQASLGLDATVAEAWNIGHRMMMQDVTATLQQNDGYMIGKDSFELGDHANAVLQESCPARNETIEVLQNLTATSRRLNQRLIYQCHTFDLTESILAAFLCGAGPDHYITLGSWNGDSPGFPSHWHPLFEKPLGEPLNDAIYNPETTVWTRHFASGTVVNFDATSCLGTIQWSDTFVEPVIVRES